MCGRRGARRREPGPASPSSQYTSPHGDAFPALGTFAFVFMGHHQASARVGWGWGRATAALPAPHRLLPRAVARQTFFAYNSLRAASSARFAATINLAIAGSLTLS